MIIMIIIIIIIIIITIIIIIITIIINYKPAEKSPSRDELCGMLRTSPLRSAI